MHSSLRFPSAACGLLAMLAVLLWQAATVHFNYRDNWSALFCTGEILGVAPAVAHESVYTFPKARGWDGQFYHYIAHDPWIQRDLWKSIDAARLRYRRILIPGAAHVLVFGRQDGIDWSYRIVILAFVFLGSYWLSRVASAYGRSPWWGLGFLLLPSTLVSIDRMAVDVALSALCMGFALYAAKPARDGRLYAVLVAAGLARDTGLILVFGWCFWLLWNRQWKRAAWFATAALPTLAWYAYINGHTPPFAYHALVSVPFTGMLHRVMNPMPYPFAPILNLTLISLDRLAVLGILVMVVLSGYAAKRIGMQPVSVVLVVFALLAVVNWYPGDWLEAYDFGRIFAPALALLALRGLRERRWLWFLPLLMILPCIAMQFGSQIYRVIVGLV